MRTLPTIILAIVSTSLFAQDLEDQLQSELVSKWERARDYTLEFLAAVPDDKVDYQATPEVRSFAQQILHMNQGTIGLVANGTDQERIYPGVNLEEQTDLYSKEELIKDLEEYINSLSEWNDDIKEIEQVVNSSLEGFLEFLNNYFTTRVIQLRLYIDNP